MLIYVFSISVDTPKRCLFDGLEGADTPGSATVQPMPRSVSECSSDAGMYLQFIRLCIYVSDIKQFDQLHEIMGSF